MKSSDGKRRLVNWVIIIGLVVVTIMPRLYLLLHTHSYSSDGVSYLSTALWIRNPEMIGEVPKRIYFILFPLLTLLADIFTHNITLAGRIINLLVGVAIPVVAFLIGRKIFGHVVGLIGWLFCAINPILIMQSAEIRGDSLFALATLVAILFFEKIDWKNPRLRDSIFFALVLGMCQLARTNGVMYLFVVIPLWLWIHKGSEPFDKYLHKQTMYFQKALTPFTKPWFWRTLVPFALVFAAISSIPNILLAVRGEPRPSMFMYTYLDGNIAALGDRESAFFKLNADATEYQIIEDTSHAGMKDVIDSLPSLPHKFAKNFGYAVMLLFGPAIEVILKLSIILLPLLFYIFYYWGEVKIPDGTGRLLFWSWPSFILLPLINVEDLYFLPLIPILMLLAGWLLNVTSSLGWIAKWRGWVLAILIVIIIVPMSAKSMSDIKAEAKYINPYLLAGEWIGKNTPPDSKIMARNPEVFFHSMRHGYRMPIEDLNRTLIFALHRDVKYLVFGPSEMNKRKDLFLEAYKEVYNSGKASRLKLVKTIDTGQDIVYIVEVIPENFKVGSLPKTG